MLVDGKWINSNSKERITVINPATGDTVRKSFDNMGQICNSINRIYLIRSIADEFSDKFVKRTKDLVIANGLTVPDADLGPMISKEQRDLVAYVYTKDLESILYATKQLEYGTVDINNVLGGNASYPYGGWKESGLGLELSHYGLDEYLDENM